MYRDIQRNHPFISSLQCIAKLIEIRSPLGPGTIKELLPPRSNSPSLTQTPSTIPTWIQVKSGFPPKMAPSAGKPSKPKNASTRKPAKAKAKKTNGDQADDTENAENTTIDADFTPILRCEGVAEWRSSDVANKFGVGETAILTPDDDQAAIKRNKKTWDNTGHGDGVHVLLKWNM
ncbi:uncharacterized protein Triagg1_5935 [Trichoderma aggressivum f. europaeum]|uniref:Uncharacterized protein n=1 Tax=Trichoderma aggressivum f. europaeum TaxID=173218 RepID=A0AAE1LY41_9HYPO|nr:hypothetical protein Triagg1_5935 [Trichoderma aggressivum f. europaeum]